MNFSRNRNWFALISACCFGLALYLIFGASRSLPDSRFVNLSEEEAAITLGMYYIQEKPMPMQGIKVLTAMADKNPQSTNLQSILANMSMQTGQYEKAIGRFDNLSKITNGADRESAIYKKSEAALLAGDTTLSVNALNELLAISKDSLLLQSVKNRITELTKHKN